MYGILLPIYLTELGPTVVQGVCVFTLISVANLTLQIFGDWISDSIGRLRTIAIGSVGLLSPTYQSLVSKVVPQENLGVFISMFRSSLGLISLPAPWIGAQLWDRFNPRVPLIITAILALISVIPTWFKFKLPDEQQTGEPIPDNSISTSAED
jgi:MFS family permease